MEAPTGERIYNYNGWPGREPNQRPSDNVDIEHLGAANIPEQGARWRQGLRKRTEKIRVIKPSLQNVGSHLVQDTDQTHHSAQIRDPAPHVKGVQLNAGICQRRPHYSRPSHTYHD
jgi:hypothetical protein